MLAYTVISQRVGNGVGNATVAKNSQEQSPVLTLANSRHIVLMSQFLNIIDGSQTANLVVALQLFKGKMLRRYDNTLILIMLVADNVGCETKCTVVLVHKGNLLFQLLRKPSVIAVTESDVSSLRTFNRLVASISWTVVAVQIEHVHTAVLLTIVPQDAKCLFVVRMIIGDEQLQMFICLVQDAVNTVCQVLGSII